MSGFFDAVGDFFSSAFDVIGDVFEAVGDLAEDVLDAVGDGLESIGNTIQGILDDPLPTLLQIGGSMIGIPPYVTSAVITAARGGDLGDIAKSAAVSYASTEFMSNTQIGADIKNYTSNQWAGDFTDSMMENFNLTPDQAVSIAKVASSSMNSAIIGGVNAVISGKDVMDGISKGFSSGLIYSSTDSYFDSLNKDPNWGFSKTTLDLMKGATSTALNTLASGKGDPAAAVGNYIAYATLKLGSSELYKTAQKSYDEFTGAKDKAITAQDDYVKAKAEFDTKVKKYNTEASSLDTDVKNFDKYIDETFNPVKEKLDDLGSKQQEQIEIRETAMKSFEDNKWAYNNYDAKMRQDGYQMVGGDEYSAGYYAKLVGARYEQRYDWENGYYNALVPDGSIRDSEGNPTYRWQAGPTQDSFYQAAKKDVDLAKAATAKANEYGTQAKDYYEANKSVIDKVGELKTAIETKATNLATLKTDLETPNGSNVAQRLKDASDAYQKAYDTLSSKEGVANRAAENYSKMVAEISARDVAIDALNTGAIKVTGVNDDGSYTLSNNMTLKDGKFFQDGQQLFTNAGGIEQKNLNFTDNSGNNVMYDSSAGRLMSNSDIKQLFKRDYGYDLTDEQAKEFVGKDFGKVDTQRLQDIAIDRIEDEFRAITLRNPTQDEVNRIKDADNVIQAAQDAAINGLDLPADYIFPDASQQEKISYGRAYAAARVLGGPGTKFQWFNEKTGQMENHIAESREEKADRVGREAAAAQARIDMMPAYGEAGAGRGSATGRPANAENIFIDNKTGDVVIDDRKFDRYGNVISGSIKTAPETTALNVAKALFVDAGAQLTDAFASAAKFLGVMDRNGETSQKVKQLTDYAESIKPAEVKAESQAFWDGLSKVKGIQDTVKYIANSVVDKPLMTGFNITSEIIQTLGTMGTGAGAKYAAKVLQAAPAIAAKLGIGVDMVLNVAESAGASYNEAYDRERKLLDNYVKTGVMTKEEADLQAADKANKAFLTAGGITGAILNIPGGNALSKQVLRDTASGQAVESAYKTAIKTGLKETGSEGLEAGAIEAATQKIIDPNADLNWKDIVSTGMLEAIYGGGHSTIIAGADASLSNISQRLANVGMSQGEIDLIRKGIADSVYDGGTTLDQDRETVANYLMDRYGYTEPTAKAISNAMVDATAEVTVNSFLKDTGLDSSKIAQVSPLVLDAINTGGDINTVAQNVSNVLQNAGIEAQNALSYTKAFLPTAKVETGTGQTVTAPTVQISKPADLTTVVTPAGGTNTAGNSTNVGGSTGSTTTTTGSTTNTSTTPTVTSTTTLANGNTSVTYSNGNVVVFDKTGTPVTSVDTSTTTGGGNVAVTADLNAVADALADLNKAVSSAQQGNTDSFTAINQAIADLKTSGLTTDQVQNLIDTSLTSTNTALATALAEANKGNTKAITDLQTGLETKIDELVASGKTQSEATAQALSDIGVTISNINTGLEAKIGDLGTDMQTKFDAMSDAQKALVESQVQQGKDLTQAINDVSTGLETKIGELSTDVQSKFDALSDAQKAEVQNRTKMGEDLNTAINNVSTTLSGELKTGLADISADVGSKFDALTSAQKAEVQARVQMGEDINTAINDVSTKLESQITDLGTDVETKFDAVTKAQTEMGTQFNTRVDELVQQGKTYQEATDLALKELGSSITDIQTEQQKQEIVRKASQKAAAEKAAREKGMASAMSLVTAPSAVDDDTAKFKKPFQTTGEGEKFEGPLAKFLKQAQQGSFVPQQGQQGKQVPITEVTDRLERSQDQQGQQEGYYNYGQANDIDQILNPDSINESLFQKDTLGAKAGGLMAAPLMATGGSMTGTRYGQYAGGGLNVVHHSGKARVDFRRGDAVTGPGDGQSDDIPAMLADGEFVIPADVVAALGNGSTKAGSDKLYDMMHSVRAYHRSAKPKDLPPPAKKSPLDYLTKRKARG